LFVMFVFNWNDTLGIGVEVGFTFIQKYTGFIIPGVFAMFLLGMFWKRTTGSAAIAGVICGFLLSVFFNNYAPGVLGNETILYTAYPNGKGGYEIPFLINMGWSFFFTTLLMIIISFSGPKVNPKAFIFDKEMFKISKSVLVLIVITILLLTVLYVRFW